MPSAEEWMDHPLDEDSPFFKEFMADQEKRLNGEQIMTVNGSPMGYAIWNLICSKRDLELWTKIGMKPTRHWKVTTVKKYFGIKGTGDKLLERFMVIFDFVMGER